MRLRRKPKRKQTSYRKRGRPEGSLSPKWKKIIVKYVPEIIKEVQPYPITLRQIFYQLIANYGLKKTESNYNYLCKKVVQARKSGFIQWDKIVDLTRKPTQKEWIGEGLTPKEWFNHFLSKFIDDLRSFNIPNFKNQNYLVEVWSEHEGLKPLFEKALEGYNLTLYFTKGRNSWSANYQAYERLKNVKRDIVILHFADADKYGKEMTSDIKDAFSHFWINAKIERVALTKQQVQKWNLPDIQLEAIPVKKFVNLIRESVEKYIDKQKLQQIYYEIDKGQQQIDEWIEDEYLEDIEK